MTDPKADIVRRMNALKWYHKIDLGDGIVTPGRDYDAIWDGTRSVLDKVDYAGRRVLDIASWDGYWAFEAERRGAARVVSSDARIEGYQNLLFAREVLRSNVIPLCNVPVQDLENRLNIIGLEPEFDIVHHFGLLYHLRDPMLSLAQVRKVLAPDGLLLLETAAIEDDENSYMAFSGVEGNFHFYNISDTWAPTRLCLKEMLLRSFLEPVREPDWSSVRQKAKLRLLGRDLQLSRLTLLARPMPVEKGHVVDARKVFGSQ